MSPHNIDTRSLIVAALALAASFVPVMAQNTPRVTIATGNPRPVTTKVPTARAATGPLIRSVYPWKLNVVSTVFWIGETPTQNNPTPNNKSSWDTSWESNFGGFDDPDPSNRIADPRTGDFRPKNFVPKLNPFYVALPYNDVESFRRHKPEASKVIPWFGIHNPEPGKTVLKGRWVQIYNGKRVCYAQWEDCGPWVTDDWEYVFGSKPPKNTSNQGAGIDLSPSIRDFLDLRSGDRVHWRFVDASQVPYGPWKRYGTQVDEQQRKYLEYMRTLRAQQTVGTTTTNRG